MAHAPAPTDDRLGAEAADVMTSRGMTVDACWRHLDDTASGRVVLVHHGRPLDVPVHHVVDGRTIVFRTGAGSPLGLLPSREPVKFEVDDASTSTGRSVRVVGEIERVEPHVREQIDPAPAPWAPGQVEAWMRIVPISVTGREHTRSSASDHGLLLAAAP
jgi:nitroimidazol reductase NimA-like FMN-containing flavoprotein (pyridoxamine 5'-phosphate oxidase superfamily)